MKLFREDNFTVYIGIMYFILQVGTSMITNSLWAILFTPAYFVFLVLFIGLNYNREVKWYSPFPVKLSGRWTWHFYVIRGSYMVHPTDHLYNKISK